MLSTEENELFTKVGPDSLMGELLRRYWHPIAAVVELDNHPVKKVRLLGEDLALFRDRSGNLGLVQERCPHRSASLAYGMPDECGLRCMYHGWLFDASGNCVDQPNEPEFSRFKDSIHIRAYPVEQLGGLIFAYLGPLPAPLLPRWDLFVEQGNVVRQITQTTVPCNWLQIMENSVDPVHLEWAHGRYFEWVLEQSGATVDRTFCAHHEKIGFDEFEFGIIKRRVLEGGTEEDEDWRVGHPLIFPSMLRVGNKFNHVFQIRVPIDDTHTWHLWYQVIKLPEDIKVASRGDRVPLVTASFTGGEGEFLVNSVNGQDFTAWVTQGSITDRSVEALGTTDQGIVMYRNMLKRELDKVRKGRDPMGIVRDASQNRMITLPQEEDKYKASLRPRRGMFDSVGWDYAPEVRQAIDDLMKAYG